MLRHDRQSAGFSLVELLIVISLIGIIAGLIIPAANRDQHGRLKSAAGMVASDIGYARGLAVANDSSYRLTFDLANNQYVLQHSGTNTALDNLPPSPYHLRSDSPTQHTVRLADLPRTGEPVRLHVVFATGAPSPEVTTLEFGPLGETTRPQETVVWLAIGAGPATRYMSVRVSPVTGLTWIESFQASDPRGSGS